MAMSHWILLIAIVMFTAVAALCDLRTKRLPNALTVPAFLLALVYHTSSGAIESGVSGAADGLVFALFGFATGFGILLVLWLVGGGGGGDVKFMGALGAWLGSTMTMQVFLVSAVLVLFGAVLVLTYEAIQRGINRTRGDDRCPADSDNDQSNLDLAEARIRCRLMPYGVPVAVSTWLVLAVSELSKLG